MSVFYDGPNLPKDYDLKMEILEIVTEWDNLNRRGISRKEVNFAPYLEKIMTVIREKS